MTWIEGEGYKVYQGSGKVQGHIVSACSGPLGLMLGTRLFPKADLWKDSIIFYEGGAGYGIMLAGVHAMRGFAATGMFSQAKALVLPKISDEEVNEIILKVLREEGLTDLPVFAGVAFGHLNPMTVLPIGVEAEIDCDNKTFTILGSGVN